MNDEERGYGTGYSSLKGIHRAVPIILGALAVFVAVCYITDGTGMFGNGITSVLLGLFSYGAYAIPLLLLMHAFFYSHDHAKELTLARAIFSFVIVLIVSAVQYAITFWSSEPVFDPALFFSERSAGGYIGSILAFGIIKVIGAIGLIILCVAVIIIYLVFFFSKGDSAFSKLVLSVLGVFAGMLAVIEKEIKRASAAAKERRAEKQKRDADRRSAELLDDSFFAVDNGMKELTITELGIHESRGEDAFESNPTLQEKVFPKSAKREEFEAPKRTDTFEDKTDSFEDKRKNIDLTYGLDEDTLHHDFIIPEEDVREITEEETETVKEPEETKSDASAFGIDESADAVFTRSFDPFDFATAGKTAAKRSSKAQGIKNEYEGISEMARPLSSITEEDLERVEKRRRDAERLSALEERRRQFEERKKTIVSGAKNEAPAPVKRTEIDLGRGEVTKTETARETVTPEAKLPRTAEPVFAMKEEAPVEAKPKKEISFTEDSLPSNSGFKIDEGGITVTYGKPEYVSTETDRAAEAIANIVAKNNPAYMRSANESYTVMKVTNPGLDETSPEVAKAFEEKSSRNAEAAIASDVDTAEKTSGGEDQSNNVIQFEFETRERDPRADLPEVTPVTDTSSKESSDAEEDSEVMPEEKNEGTSDGYILTELTPIETSKNEENSEAEHYIPLTIEESAPVAGEPALGPYTPVSEPAVNYAAKEIRNESEYKQPESAVRESYTPAVKGYSEPVESYAPPAPEPVSEVQSEPTFKPYTPPTDKIEMPEEPVPVREDTLRLERSMLRPTSSPAYREERADREPSFTVELGESSSAYGEPESARAYSEPERYSSPISEPAPTVEPREGYSAPMSEPAQSYTAAVAEEPVERVNTYEVERNKRFTVIDEAMPLYEKTETEPEVPEDTIDWSSNLSSDPDTEQEVNITENSEATIFDFGQDDTDDEEIEEDDISDDSNEIFLPDDDEPIPPEEQNPDVLIQRQMFPSIFEESEDCDESEEDTEDDSPYDGGVGGIIDDMPEEDPLIEPTPLPPRDGVADAETEEEPDEDDGIPPFEIEEPKPSVSAPAPVKDKAEEKKEEKKKPDYSNFVFPSIELLGKDDSYEDDDTQYEIQENADKLIDTLSSFNVTASIKGVDRGPRITRYEVVPAKGVKVSNVMNLQDDIALNLAAGDIRMEAPIPGKSAIGVEIPNKHPTTVRLRDLLESEEFVAHKSKTAVCIGKDVAGCPVFGDIAKMPHLLIAGATGMGKSVCINSLMISMLYKARPDEVKFIMIDPKQVEFTMYNGIPHLLVPVVSDSKQAAGALMWAVEEMEKRYELIKNLLVRNIDAYNAKVTEDPSLGEPLSRIIIVIDEFADLMLQVRDPVESLVMSIAQKARAAGIHLIIGTQRPSVNVITGTIKANVPSRMSCKVASNVDSRTILETAGAEKLLDKGDMLFSFAGAVKPIRVQGAFVSDSEVEAVMKHLKSFSNGDSYDSSVMEEIERAAQKCSKKGGGSDYDDDDRDGSGSEGYLNDKQFLDAVEVAVNSGKISTSLLQRRISIGYGKAAKFIDVMCDMGIVGEPNGQRPRDVLITADEWREKLARVSLD